MQRLVFVLMLGLACTLALTGARAAGDPYTMSGIRVDATGASASVAQIAAINEGRGRAWTALYRRLTRQQDWARQPPLDDTALQRMVRNYIVLNERRSTTQFVADMTYVFNADAVRRLLRAQGISYIDTEAKPVLVVPMAPGYSARSAWTALWAGSRYAGATVPMMTPAGDDTQSLNGLNFATAQWPDVEPSASHVHAAEAFLVQATLEKGSITVALRHLGPGASPPIPNITVPVRPGETGAQAYAAAADAAAEAIIDFWKTRSAIDFGKHLKLVVDARIASLSEWGALMQKLATIPTVTDVNVVAMNTGEARIAISYVGSADQLQVFAAQSDLSLSNNAGTWQLAIQTSAAP